MTHRCCRHARRQQRHVGAGPAHSQRLRRSSFPRTSDYCFFVDLDDAGTKVCATLEMSVSDLKYTEAVTRVFGSNCCYCGRVLETDRAAVEHLDGMNRFQIGLHIPGNVIMACTHCNREKRRDDQLEKLVLAGSGRSVFSSTTQPAARRNARPAPTGGGPSGRVPPIARNTLGMPASSQSHINRRIPSATGHGGCKFPRGPWFQRVVRGTWPWHA